MLVAIQFPFADVRPFTSEATGRLGVPVWPLAEPGREFVRGFGPIRSQWTAPPTEWPSDEVFCQATRAIRFTSGLQTLAHDVGHLGLSPGRTFRRFSYDGRVVARLTIAFAFRRSYWSRTSLGPADCLALLEGVLGVQVSILGSDSRRIPVPLLQCPRHLASRYIRATTRFSNGLPQAARNWWFTPGQPLALVEYGKDEIAALPHGTRSVDPAPSTDAGLNHYRLSYRGTLVGVSFVRNSDPPDPELQRRLRRHLLRLDAERESLKQVLRLIAQSRIVVERGTDASNVLQGYLRDAQRFLQRSTREGLAQSDILAAAQQFEEIVNEEQRETLLTNLSQIRGNILRFVKQYTQADKRSVGGNITVIGPGTTINQATQQTIGGQTVTSYKIEFGDHSTFNGDFVVANSIQGSFNKVKESNVPQELRENLMELTKAVAEMVKHLPPDEARQASGDLEVLTTEATSPKPRAKWYELSAEGLVKAAKNVGEVATPVVGLIGKILGLLAGAAIV